jgi:hypothetical protein
MKKVILIVVTCLMLVATSAYADKPDKPGKPGKIDICLIYPDACLPKPPKPPKCPTEGPPTCDPTFP